MWSDPIVEEVRKYRDEHARKFHYDIDRIYEDLKSSEEQRRQQNSVREEKVKYSYAKEK